MTAQRNDSNVVVTEAAKGNLPQLSADGGATTTKPSKTKTDGQKADLPEQSARPLGYGTRWGAWIIITLGWGMSLAGVITRGGAVETFMLIVLSLLPVLSIGMPLLGAAGLTADRIIPKLKVKDGDEAVVRLTVRRTIGVPFVWLAVQDAMTNTSSAEKKGIDYRYIAMPLIKREVELHYSVLAVRRGEHQFDHVTVTVGDWLGLTAFRKKLSCPGTLLAVPALPEEMRREAGQLYGAVAEQVSGDSSAAYISDQGEISDRSAGRLRQSGLGPESRPYRDGDSMRHLEWRAAAKGRGMFTKQHLLEQPAEVIMIADTHATAYNRDGRLFDATLAWMARGMELAAAEGCDVRLITGTTGGKREGKVRKGNQEERKRDGLTRQATLLEQLAKLQLRKTAVAIDHLRTELGGLKAGGTVHVYTADWKSGQSWIQLAAYAKDQNCRVSLHIVTRQAVLTYAMREQQRLLEETGLLVHWLAYPERMNRLPETVEGGGQHANVQS
ncbi:DUF58 domain-containing protein [Paenibacillus glycanilyticus]|uniref:DUF58 domain-containing protein n=1 Tax=Paenibacillus glycanilyticus TaxID=126569 RepID=A0ABQ6GMC5_9BACL|nr:DUF58 domain-containing protein [Paenibacillus glycanilyticus]GLX70177.1 hypothetical protein MU1_45230 [Paenibacillus glycanilyticus]